MLKVGAKGDPCPCCGAGVAVDTDDPNVSLGGPPASLMIVGPSAFFASKGGG